MKERRLKKVIKNLKGRFWLSKRQKFILVTSFLTLSLVATQLFSIGLDIRAFVFLTLSAYVLPLWAFRGAMTRWDYITLLILPSFYTAAVYLFYLLLPVRWLTRLPIAFLYALGMYAILLTENIYHVASQRNIQLLRAAHSVGFLLTLMTVFFLMDTVVSMHMPFYLNGLVVFMIIFPLTLQALWSMELTRTISSRTWISTLAITIILAEMVIILSFWPIKTTIEALFITTTFYTLVGMTQQYLVGRLFKKTTREFVMVFVVVLMLVFVSTKWGAGT